MGGWLAEKNADLNQDMEASQISDQKCSFIFPDNRGIELDQRKNISIGQGAWHQAAWHIATTICTPAAYATLPSAFAWLGWPAGIISLFIGAIFSWYNSYLLVAMNQGPNGERRMRYPEVAREIWGIWGWRIVTFFQQFGTLLQLTRSLISV